jgi:hypothetical protein
MTAKCWELMVSYCYLTIGLDETVEPSQLTTDAVKLKP